MDFIHQLAPVIKEMIMITISILMGWITGNYIIAKRLMAACVVGIIFSLFILLVPFLLG